MAPVLLSGQREVGYRVAHFLIVAECCGHHHEAAVRAVHGHVGFLSAEVGELCRFLCAAFFEVGGEYGRHRQCRAEGRAPCGVGFDVFVLDAGICDVGGEGELVEPCAVLGGVECRDAEVAAHGEAFVVRAVEVAAHDAVLGVVAERQHVVDFFGSAADGYLVVHHGCVVVEHLFLPVCAGAVGGGVGKARSNARVDCAFVHHHGIFHGIEHLALLGHALPAVAEVIRYACGAFLALLGGDEDNAVCRTGTVYGAGSGVLKYLDRGDVVGV